MSRIVRFPRDTPGIAVVPREAYTTPCSPADRTKLSRSEGRAFAGAGVVGPTVTMCGDMESAFEMAQSVGEEDCRCLPVRLPVGERGDVVLNPACTTNLGTHLLHQN